MQAEESPELIQSHWGKLGQENIQQFPISLVSFSRI